MFPGDSVDEGPGICHCCGSRCCCGASSIPGLGASTYLREISSFSYLAWMPGAGRGPLKALSRRATRVGGREGKSGATLPARVDVGQGWPLPRGMEEVAMVSISELLQTVTGRPFPVRGKGSACAQKPFEQSGEERRLGTHLIWWPSVPGPPAPRLLALPAHLVSLAGSSTA